MEIVIEHNKENNFLLITNKSEKVLLMKIIETECDCEECSRMCHAPCCGTPQEMNMLIENGYGDRLMYDDLPGGADLLKPALKGFEGKKSPWEVSSLEGCTFWKDGKCELHSLKLKPYQGRYTHHSLTDQQYGELGEYINDSWNSLEAKEVIKKWNETN